MAGVEIDYAKLETFLRGDVSLEDLKTRRFNRFDLTVIAYALVAAHLDELSYDINGECLLKDALSRTLNRYSPYFLFSSHTDASLMLGLHQSRGRGNLTALVLPDRFIELVNQYKDDPQGDIAKFTALKRGNAGQDGIDPDVVATDVIARLRRTYGEEVLEIIRRTL